MSCPEVNFNFPLNLKFEIVRRAIIDISFFQHACHDGDSVVKEKTQMSLQGQGSVIIIMEFMPRTGVD